MSIRARLLFAALIASSTACADNTTEEPDAGFVDATPRADATISDSGASDARADAPDADAPDAAPDAAPDDVGTLDAEADDAGTLDAEADDVGSLDAEPDDVGTLDAAPLDAEPLDAGSLDASAPDASTPDAGPTPVVPLYAAAIGWNDYVRADGVDRLTASGAACDAAADGPRSDACIHAGELRSVDVPSRASCAGLTAEDALGAFEWTCVEAPVRVVSTGLAPGKRLADLIDWTATPVGWRANHVRVFDGATLVHESAPELWWPNAVVESAQAGTVSAGFPPVISPDGVLNVASTIYAVTSSSTGTYELRAEKTAITMAPGVKVTSAGQIAAVISNAPFTWVEGLVGAQANYGATFGSNMRFGVVRDFVVDGAVGGLLVSARKSSFRRIEVRNLSSTSPTQALHLFAGDHNDVDGLVAVGVTGGITFSGSDDVVRNVVIRDARAESVRYTGAFRNLLIDAHISGGSNGVVLESTALRNTLVRVRVANNARYGFEVRGGSNLFLDVEASNVGQAGMTILSPDNRVLGATFVGAGSGWGFGSNISMAVTSVHAYNQPPFSVSGARQHAASIVTANALWEIIGGPGGGFVFNGSAASRVSELHTVYGLATAHHTGPGVTLYFAHDTRFDGPLLVGDSSTDCVVSGGTNPGLSVGPAGCAPQGASTAVITTGVDLSASFVGPVTVDDPVAPDDVNGTAARASITDWSATSATHRLWSRAGSSVTDTAARGRCTGTDTCQLWDLALRATDTVLRDRLPLPTGDDVVVHTWSPTASGPCGLIPGGATWTGTACQSTFLRGAIELFDDGTGDDDGLCESNETCLHLANLGAYQGDGPLVPAGPFVDGQLTGITLVRYANNGR
ncbi:hypothetical protein L6R52_14695 [Myxococcota bacterium]|nr:hypothetical protein [Myxococcota bacterium]